MRYKNLDFPQNLFCDAYDKMGRKGESIPENMDAILKWFLPSLPERDADIIVSYYKQRETLDAIALKYGISWVRAQQIRDRALRTMRHKLDVVGSTGIYRYGTVWELELSVCITRQLLRHGINTVMELCQVPPEDFTHMRNIGPYRTRCILDALRKYGINYVELHADEFTEETAEFFGLTSAEFKEVYK